MKSIHLPLSILFILLSVLAPNIYSQEQDSLSEITADTIKANALWLEMNKDITSGAYSEAALQKGIEAKQLYVKHFGKHNCRVGYLSRQIGLLLLNQNRPNDAIDTLEYALEAYGSKKCGKRPQQATVNYHLAIALVKIGAFQQAVEAGEKALALELEFYNGPQVVDVALSYSSLAEIYSLMGNVDRALHYNQLAEGIYLELAPEDHEGLGVVYYNRGVIYFRIGDTAESMTLMSKARTLIGGSTATGLINDGDILSALATAEVNAEKFESGVDKGLQAIEILKDGSQGNLMKIAQLHITIATAYKKLGDFALANEQFEKAEEIILELPIKRKYYLHYIYNNWADLYIGVADFQKGEEKLLLALENLDSTEQKNEAIISNIRGNLIQLYQMTGRYPEAQTLLGKELGEKSERLGQRNMNLASAYMALGHNHYYLEEYDKALGYFRKGLNLFPSRLERDAVYFHSSIAEMYIRLDKPNSAITHLDSALLITKGNSKAEHPEILKIKGAKVISLTYLGRFEEAGTLLESCLVGVNFQVRQVYDQIANHYLFLDIISTAGWYFQEKYMSQKKQQDLKESDKYYKAYTAAMDHFLKTANQFGYRDNLSSLNCCMNGFYFRGVVGKHPDELLSLVDFVPSPKDILERNDLDILSIFMQQRLSYSSQVNDFRALTTKRLLFLETGEMNYLKEGFQYMERSKASSLVVALQNVKAVAELPEPLSLAERRFRRDIGELEKRWYIAQSSDDQDAYPIYEKLQEQRKYYQSFIEYLDKTYPNYHQAKYDFGTISLEEVQQNLLREDETLVEYQVGRDSIILYLVKKHHFEVRQIHNAPVFKNWVEAIQVGKKDFYKQEEALAIYELLLEPVEKQLTDKLIIIPDGTLGYIPFELLLTELPENRYDHSHTHYLIDRKEISYCYSATLLKEMRGKVHLETTNYELLGLAPFSPADTVRLGSNRLFRSMELGDPVLPDLPASRSEVVSVSTLLDGDAFCGTVANLDLFKELAEQYRILLLATHAVVNDRLGNFSFLALAHPDSTNLYQKLYIHDLYSYSLNADMVVLSACKTGVGYYQRGEGLISLARAVSYAGGKSVFTTLWPVDDQASKELVVSFFRHLRSDQGLRKSEALRQAKLEYIKNHSGIDANPLYWAGFIGIGDMSPIYDNP